MSVCSLPMKSRRILARFVLPLPHMPALFLMSLIQISGHKMAALTLKSQLLFFKVDQRSALFFFSFFLFIFCLQCP